MKEEFIDTMTIKQNFSYNKTIEYGLKTQKPRFYCWSFWYKIYEEIHLCIQYYEFMNAFDKKHLMKLRP
jgi:hypothetical protein